MFVLSSHHCPPAILLFHPLFAFFFPLFLLFLLPFLTTSLPFLFLPSFLPLPRFLHSAILSSSPSSLFSFLFFFLLLVFPLCPFPSFQFLLSSMSLYLSLFVSPFLQHFFSLLSFSLLHLSLPLCLLSLCLSSFDQFIFSFSQSGIPLPFFFQLCPILLFFPLFSFCLFFSSHLLFSVSTIPPSSSSRPFIPQPFSTLLSSLPPALHQSFIPSFLSLLEDHRLLHVSNELRRLEVDVVGLPGTRKPDSDKTTVGRTPTTGPLLLILVSLRYRHSQTSLAKCC